MSIQVIGVMGASVQDSPLVSSLLRCAQNSAAPLLNQKAAVQAFRLMDITEEVLTYTYLILIEM